MSWLAHLWWWFEVHTGTVTEAGPYYGFFSGFGSDIGEVVLIGGVVSIYRRHNCQHRPCLRISRHTTGDGYALCKKHIAMPKDQLELHDVHPDHR